MARFDLEVPNDLVKVFEDLDANSEKILGEMCQRGAETVHRLILSNMKGVFSRTDSLERGLKLTKVYKTPSDDGINVKIAFYGYKPNTTRTKRHPKGTPIPLIAMAREYGTSRGEKKRAFVRKSFNKSQIESAMREVEEQYLPKE